jgi:hypothetical protein
MKRKENRRKEEETEGRMEKQKNKKGEREGKMEKTKHQREVGEWKGKSKRSGSEIIRAHWKRSPWHRRQRAGSPAAMEGAVVAMLHIESNEKRLEKRKGMFRSTTAAITMDRLSHLKRANRVKRNIKRTEQMLLHMVPTQKNKTKNKTQHNEQWANDAAAASGEPNDQNRDENTTQRGRSNMRWAHPVASQANKTRTKHNTKRTAQNEVTAPGGEPNEQNKHENTTQKRTEQQEVTAPGADRQPQRVGVA